MSARGGGAKAVRPVDATQRPPAVGARGPLVEHVLWRRLGLRWSRLCGGLPERVHRLPPDVRLHGDLPVHAERGRLVRSLCSGHVVRPCDAGRGARGLGGVARRPRQLPACLLASAERVGEELVDRVAAVFRSGASRRPRGRIAGEPRPGRRDRRSPRRRRPSQRRGRPRVVFLFVAGARGRHPRRGPVHVEQRPGHQPLVPRSCGRPERRWHVPSGLRRRRQVVQRATGARHAPRWAAVVHEWRGHHRRATCRRRREFAPAAAAAGHGSVGGAGRARREV
mmetsp:Transcript_87693/g.253248  ORF Transcript_87693/g.253248 Transcript_87693/m.253248 type:complete len:281 (+) Transcript_87693:183-1025(+)